MNGLMTICCALAAGSAFALMEPATPESQGVDSAAILRWIDACERTFDGGPLGALHGFVIVRHGRVIAEGTWKPFDTLNETHTLYSHSKSFTSTAVGFLADEGKVDLDERVVDIFTNEAPVQVSANLSQLRVRDLLTMNAGKKDHLLKDGSDWVRKFLAQDFVRKPGTFFKYDSDATYMLAAIVERKSGMRMMDYLKAKMFDRIGITSAWTSFSPQGIPCGGWGMSMTTRDLARFGQLYLNRGTWEGQEVLSPHWIDLATARHTWSGAIAVTGEDGDDWHQGYGFQFWRCTHDVYRADGASGQYTVVMPAQDAVVSIHAGLGNMKKELKLVWEHLLPALSATAKSLPENVAAQSALRDRIAALAIRPLGGEGPKGFSRAFELKGNSRGFQSVRFESDGEACRCTLVTRAGAQELSAGYGKWLKGTMRIDPENYEKLGGHVGTHRTASSCAVDADGSFHMKVYLTDDTAWFDFKVGVDGRLVGEFWGMGGCKLESK